ncbi:MAG: hypothetical protein CUN54_09040 [Phototrophicales bacterium]|nr:MAG: hypothetical protein CUN54_09040 [Phototrophicales bacterium]
MVKQQCAYIIEDDVDLGNGFAAIIKNIGLNTKVIHDGQEAWDKLMEYAPDVVVLDMHLPNVSGTDILNLIRSNANLSETRVVVISADPVMVAESNRIANYALLKPVKMQQLVKVVKRLSER